MIEITDKSLCSGCAACSMACPKKCIIMQSDEEGFRYPIVDNKICINCGLCEKTCPILNKAKFQDKIRISYAAINKDENIRLSSSSGGIFYALSQIVIESGGVVFGAKFDDNFSVVHGFADNIDDLSKFQGSKYVQSYIGESYIKAKGFLDEGKQVLFTGTPCQIGGLKAFLKKDYDNLICQDIICHGVPSPMVWDKYLKFREAKAISKLKNMFFRNKKYGWKRYSVEFEFENNSRYIKFLDDDPYMISFLKNVSIRPSCFNCTFKTENRQADITLADFWGIENVLPQMDDNKGTSLVIVHSLKGKKLFEDLFEKIDFCEVDFEKAVFYNSAMTNSVPYNNIRGIFLKEINERSFDKTVNKYLGDKLFLKIKKNLKKYLMKLKNRR